MNCIYYENKLTEITESHKQHVLTLTNEIEAKWMNNLSQSEKSVRYFFFLYSFFSVCYVYFYFFATLKLIYV